MTAVLCTRADSVYSTLGADCYDIDRDSRTYRGTGPVVAHPPCRAWGKLRHMAKPRHYEKDVGVHALCTVRMFGGVLEHPAHSGLFSLIGVRPGVRCRTGGWVLPIRQQWFGHPCRKDTWLYIVGVEPQDMPRIPLVLGDAHRTVESQCAADREKTPLELAAWLLEVAARACV